MNAEENSLDAQVFEKAVSLCLAADDRASEGRYSEAEFLLQDAIQILSNHRKGKLVNCKTHADAYRRLADVVDAQGRNGQPLRFLAEKMMGLQIDSS